MVINKKDIKYKILDSCEGNNNKRNHATTTN